MLALLFLVSLPAVTARLYASDEVHYFSYLRSLYFDRDVHFENEYRYFYEHGIAQSPGYHETFLERKTDTGRPVNYGTLGCAVLWLPFYAAADAWTRVTNSHDANGFTQPYIRAVAYASAFYGFLAILLSIRAARTITSGASVLAALAVWLGTPLLFYMYVAPPFSHACSAFAVTLFVNVWLHVRRQWTPRGAFALGLCAALVATVREQDVFVAIGPALDFVWGHRRTSMNARGDGGAGLAVSAGAAGVIATLLGYAPQLLAYTAVNGYPGPAEHVSRKMFWYSPHALQVLGSPSHGLFFWTPLSVLAIVGLFFLKDRVVAAVLVLMAASQVYVAGSVDSWSVAGAFGQRRFICLTVVLVIGLAALLNGRPRGRAFVMGFVAVCVWWNIALMAQFATRLMDRQRLEPAKNAYHAFVTLPLDAPRLLHRYLVERESFYGR